MAPSTQVSGLVLLCPVLLTHDAARQVPPADHFAHGLLAAWSGIATKVSNRSRAKVIQFCTAEHIIT